MSDAADMPDMPDMDDVAAIVRESDDAIIGRTLDGIITSWNSGAERLYGYTADEAIGQSTSLLIPPDLRTEEQSVIRQVRDGFSVRPYITERVCKDGSLVKISLTLGPIRDAEGTVIGALAIGRDLAVLQNREVELSALIEEAPDAFIVVDQHGTIQFVNRQTVVLFGYDRGQLIGQSLEMLVPDRARAAHPNLRAAYAKDPTGRGMRGRNLTGRRRDGSEFSVDVSLTSIDTGAGLLVAAAVRDVSERKDADARYEALLESAPDAILVIDADGLISLANHRTKDLFGYERDELIGEPIEKLIPAASHERHPHLRRSFFANPSARHMGEGLQLWATRKDGSEFAVDVSLAPLETPQGTLVSAAVRDITDRLRVEKALRQAKEDAEAANRAKSEFLSRMSHELRTPLTAILGFTDLLQLKGIPEDQRDSFVARTHKAGKHLLSLVNDIMDISRVQAGTMSVSIEAVAVQPVAAEVIELLAPIARQRRILVQNTIGDIIVEADLNRLKQVLLNVLSNALKYNHEGGAVTLSARENDPFMEIAVTDTGSGIAPEDLPKLFQPFERLGVNNSDIEGTGIGLSLSRALTEWMNGTIRAESTLGSGSTFTISLPRSEREVLNIPPSLDDAVTERPPATVLYIEDNPSNTVLIESALSLRPNVRLITADLGRLGLDLARQHLPDLVLLDLHLPDINGDVVLDALKTDGRTAAIPVIVLSADATPARIRDAIDAGAGMYMTKPFLIREFLDAVDGVLAVPQA